MHLVDINESAEIMADLSSKVATNSIGRIGIISGTKTFEWGQLL
jgi:hypothetical protein